MKVYEITIADAEGNWHWLRTDCADYHAAAQFGLNWADSIGDRLVRIQWIADVPVPSPSPVP